MTVQATQVLSLTRTVSADPERVFEVWTEKEHMERWSCPDPGAKVLVETDLRVGGSLRIRMEMDGGTHTAYGVYREVDPPRRLVYTWDWEEEENAMGVETLVTVDFVAVEGGTEVRVTHEGFPDGKAREEHRDGWGLCLDRFQERFG